MSLQQETLLNFAQVDNSLSVATLNVDTCVVSSSLTVTGPANFSGPLFIAGVPITGVPTTLPYLTIQNSITVGGNLYLAGDLYITGETIVSGATTFDAPVTFLEEITGLAPAFFKTLNAENLTVTGSTTISGPAYFSGPLVVSGNLIVSGTIKSSIPQIYTVSQDAATIQGCINLCITPAYSKPYVVQIPPGEYTEDLVLRGSVQLKGMCNPRAQSGVNVNGVHTYTGSSSNVVDNRTSVGNIHFNNISPGSYTLSVTGVTQTYLDIDDCYLYGPSSHLNVLTGATVSARNTEFGQSPHISNSWHVQCGGGNFYAQNGTNFNGGASALHMAAVTGYAELTNSRMEISGPYIVDVCPGAIVNANYCTFINKSTTGDGLLISGVYPSYGFFGSGFNTFSVISGSTNYVVNGNNGIYVNTFNTYSNVSGVFFTDSNFQRNTRIRNTIISGVPTNTLTPAS